MLVINLIPFEYSRISLVESLKIISFTLGACPFGGAHQRGPFGDKFRLGLLPGIFSFNAIFSIPVGLSIPSNLCFAVQVLLLFCFLVPYVFDDSFDVCEAGGCYVGFRI